MNYRTVSHNGNACVPLGAMTNAVMKVYMYMYLLPVGNLELAASKQTVWVQEAIKTLSGKKNSKKYQIPL